MKAFVISQKPYETAKRDTATYGQSIITENPNGKQVLCFCHEVLYGMNKELRELQKQFMPEDTKAGLIQSFLDDFSGTHPVWLFPFQGGVSLWQITKSCLVKEIAWRFRFGADTR